MSNSHLTSIEQYARAPRPVNKFSVVRWDVGGVPGVEGAIKGDQTSQESRTRNTNFRERFQSTPG